MLILIISALLVVEIYCASYTKTNNCFTDCFRTDNSTISLFYCKY